MLSNTFLKSETGASYYAKSSSLSPQHYQLLLDRGWRRSGRVLYKPDLHRSCCPHYTIRLNAIDYKPAKDHRQASNRWTRHILGEHYVSEAAKRYPISKKEKALRKNGFDLCHAVHESEYRVLKTPPTPAHKFEVTLEPDTFTEEKFALFNDYQRNVHKEPPSMISRSGFKGFLCSSPLIRTTRESGSPFGSYHQCYRVDGELVAIGVIDLLPHSVSAVYFIYRDDVSKWNFGKLGALREAALTIEEGLKYYYMGYYIHSCIKMRYKGDYSPQFVLDPETYDWDALDDDLRSRLDVRKYVSLSRERRLGIGAPTEKRAQDNTPETQSAPDADESESSNTTSSLFSTSMPGVLTASQVSTTMDLGKVRIRVRGVEADAEDLVTWTRDAIDSPYSIKGIIAELAATVGPEVLRGIVVEF